MKLTLGENPPKSNASNNCWDPDPVPTNGSKYLTIAGGTLCNTRFISIPLALVTSIPSDADTASRILYVCCPSTISIDALYHFTFPPESASVPYVFDNLVIYANDVPANAPVNPSAEKKSDPVCIPSVLTRLLTMLIWLTWFEYSIIAASKAV